MGFLAARFNPFGTWGILAYTQHGIGPLMQLASVTGICGIDFLITWFAAVANWAWDLRFDWSLIQHGVALYGAVLGLVLVGGGLRLALAPHRATVRVAGLAWPEGAPESGEYERVFTAVLRQAIDDQVRESMARLQEVFFERTLREARAGARIIVWAEASVLVLKGDEEALLRRARSLAQESNVYLLMGLAVLSPGADRPLENKAVFVSPAGEVMASYNKTMAVPGLERQLMKPGTGRIPVVETPYGRVASPICFDLDFPHLVRQVGVAGADLLLVPAADWEAIAHLHQAMAEFRAVENGTAMVRVTRSGGSGAVDPYGRRYAFLDIRLRTRFWWPTCRSGRVAGPCTRAWATSLPGYACLASLSWSSGRWREFSGSREPAGQGNAGGTSDSPVLDSRSGEREAALMATICHITTAREWARALDGSGIPVCRLAAPFRPRRWPRPGPGRS